MTKPKKHRQNEQGLTVSGLPVQCVNVGHQSRIGHAYLVAALLSTQGWIDGLSEESKNALRMMEARSERRAHPKKSLDR